MCATRHRAVLGTTQSPAPPQREKLEDNRDRQDADADCGEDEITRSNVRRSFADPSQRVHRLGDQDDPEHWVNERDACCEDDVQHGPPETGGVQPRDEGPCRGHRCKRRSVRRASDAANAIEGQTAKATSDPGNLHVDETLRHPIDQECRGNEKTRTGT